MRKIKIVMSTIGTAVLALALFAFGSSAATFNQSAVINFGSFTVNSAQTKTISSVYTDLAAKKCKTIESNPNEGGSYVGECAGVGGYKLEVSEGDLRQSINVIAPSGKRSELNLWTNVSSAFSHLGQKAEWRVAGKGKKAQPMALIVRYNAADKPESSDGETSYLVVAKIKGATACVTDVVKPSKDANTEARRLADASADKPCLDK